LISLIKRSASAQKMSIGAPGGQEQYADAKSQFSISKSPR